MRKVASFLLALLAFLAFPILRAQAQSLTVLYSFTGGRDGAYPLASLVRDKEGNLYGTTEYGGLGLGSGTVFKLDRFGKETVLHSFVPYTGDGTVPFGGLVRDKEGNLYGTTAGGGSFRWGTVFKVDGSGNDCAAQLCEQARWSISGSGSDHGQRGQPLRHYSIRRCLRLRNRVQANP